MANNIETAGTGNSFLFDNIKPTSSIVVPLNNSELKTLTTITGTVVDGGAAGLSNVRLIIKILGQQNISTVLMQTSYTDVASI